MAFLILFLIPAVVALGFLFFNKQSITLKEFLLQLVVQGGIAGLSVLMIYNLNTHDVEILNGVVTSKTRDRVSCSHSYSCNCYNSCSGSGKNRSCHRVCSTCYEHSHDVDWNVRSTVGTVEIYREDRQGLTEPKRWTSAKIGEPFSTTNSFENFIKAAPDTLFRHQGLIEKYKNSLPNYPSNIYDYYRLNRLVMVDKQIPDAALWANDLSNINRDIGSKSKVNMVLVITFNKPQEYFYALEQHWIGGKKNDAILVINVDDSLNITWTSVMSWTKKELYKVQLRDKINSIKTLNKDLILTAFKEETEKGFEHRSMKDFEYLKSSITPSVSQWVVSLIIGLICSVCMSLFLRKEDLFNENFNQRRYY